MFYADSCNFQGARHELAEHLRAVAKGIRLFTKSFAGADPGYYAGLWHDLGKFQPDFLGYLLQCEGPAPHRRGPDHKAAGVQLAREYAPFLCWVLQAHHGGLPNRPDHDQWFGKQGASRIHEALRLATEALSDLLPPAALKAPTIARTELDYEMFLRMLFSGLVDADYLDTERHFNRGRSEGRVASVLLPTLLERLSQSQSRFGRPSTPLAVARHEVYQHCMAAAEARPGLFTLSVPTGGGKTLSAMAFALRHAIDHGLERVIVAVPYITITEQTAQVYKDIFERSGEPPIVLEHHSGVKLGADDEDFSPPAVWSRLAAENWDAPIVVTTTVQLFESLFGNGTRTSRKLHRLAKSVIILDEAQALPHHPLKPALDGLRQLCTQYGATVVLSTATQPTFKVVEPFANLLAMEIIPAQSHYFEALRRVNYEWRVDGETPLAEVAAMMRDQPQALAVVNTKRDAMALLDALGDPQALHLSTLLCGKHRHEVILEMRARLKAGEACRLVATQVVEGGSTLIFRWCCGRWRLWTPSFRPLDGATVKGGPSVAG